MVYDLQKASLWKRISAFLFDGILLGIAAVLFAWFLSLALGYDGYRRQLADSYARYGEEYQTDLNMSLSAYESLTEEESARLQAAFDALSGDAQAVRAYQMVMHLTLLIATFGILLAYIALEFLVPLRLKNGMTLGKKIFGLALMSTEGVKINAVTLFIRTFLGKFAIETMIPVLILLMIYWGTIGIVGPAVLLAILAVQAGVLIGTRTNALIHDLLANTVVVDYASQMIFDTRADMIAYKEKIHAEMAARQSY